MSSPVTIQISPVPHQSFSCLLNGQSCVITLRQLGDALYMSLLANGEEIFNNALVNNGIPLPAFSTAKFEGHLVVIDTISNNHPSYEQLGDRYILIYDND